MKNSARFPHLLKVEVLQGLTPEFQREFVDNCTVRIFDSPTTILVQGELSPGLFMVAHGSVEVFFLGKDGQHVFLNRANVGDVIGEVEAISEHTCAASCQVSANSTVLYCPKSQLIGYLSNVRFVQNIMAVFHDHLVRDNWFKHVDHYTPIDLRLGAYLRLLSETTQKITETQTYLANVVGCSRQTINRELGKLRDLGIIAMDNGVIEVLDRSKLETPFES